VEWWLRTIAVRHINAQSLNWGLDDNWILPISISRLASKLLCYAATDGVADALPAATQLERAFLRDQLERTIQALLEPFGLSRLSVRHNRIHVLQYVGICSMSIDDDPGSMPHH